MRGINTLTFCVFFTSIAMRMRTLQKLKIQENIASMSLTILVGDFQARM